MIAKKQDGNVAEKTRKAPQTPGVYFFKNTAKKVIYIGKAKNLKARLTSYLNKNNLEARKVKMLSEVRNVSWKKTASDIEALILESELIKKHRPKYNILMRDDKKYFYVGFTKEEFPKLFITHQPIQAQNNNLKPETPKNEYIGPFTDGNSIKTVIRMLRKAFPYCQCKNFHKRPCQQAELGKCIGICCLEKKYWEKSYKNPDKLKKEYKKGIDSIKKILSGKSKTLLKSLEKEMAMLSKKQEYEKAAEARNKIGSIQNIFSHKSFLERDETEYFQKGTRYLADLLTIKQTKRIEAFDVSNIQGSSAVGSMVVLTNGLPDKSAYKKFKIRLPNTPNDTAMISEIVSRRIKHKEWPDPDVMLIDGGKAQLNAAISALRNTKHIKVVALAKREEELYLPDGRVIKLKKQPPALLHTLQLIRDEAHRFAVSYHKKLRSKYMLR